MKRIPFALAALAAAVWFASPAGGASVAPLQGTATAPVTATLGTAYLPVALRAAEPVPAPDRVWGLQFALEDMPALYEEDVAIELPRAHRAGLRAIRTNLRWDWVEPQDTEPERYDWERYDERLATYADAGFDVMVALVAYPAWATRYQCGYALLPGREAAWREFVRETARRYSGPRYKVAAWEIGNEVDGKTVVSEADHERSPDWGGGQPTTPYGGCWGDRAGAYAAFLAAAYEEIKAVDPDATVTLGGLANADIFNMFHMDFLEKLLAAGGGRYIDVLNYHWFPDVPGQVSGPEKLRRLQATMAAHGLRRPAWLTETYRLTYPAGERGEASQIRFLGQELVEVLANPDLERVYWYGWVDFPPALKAEPWHPDRGIVRATHVPKAAFEMLPYAIAYTNGAPQDLSTPGVAAYRFAWPRREPRIVAWSRTGTTEPFRLEAPRGSRAVATYFPVDMLLGGDCCGRAIVPGDDGGIFLEVGADSLFLRLEGP